MKENGKDAKGEAGLEPMLQAHLGRKLRELYDQTAREPTPERFKLLLEQLEAGEVAPVAVDTPDRPAPNE